VYMCVYARVCTHVYVVLLLDTMPRVCVCVCVCVCCLKTAPFLALLEYVVSTECVSTCLSAFTLSLAVALPHDFSLLCFSVSASLLLAITCPLCRLLCVLLHTQADTCLPAATHPATALSSAAVQSASERPPTPAHSRSPITGVLYATGHAHSASTLAGAPPPSH
jgi:hypothetical protein